MNIWLLSKSTIHRKLILDVVLQYFCCPHRTMTWMGLGSMNRSMMEYIFVIKDDYINFFLSMGCVLKNTQTITKRYNKLPGTMVEKIMRHHGGKSVNIPWCHGILWPDDRLVGKNKSKPIFCLPPMGGWDPAAPKQLFFSLQQLKSSA